MSFEVYTPTRTTLIPGQASLAGNGVLTFNAVDLQTIGVRDHVVILIDRATRRLAVRVPQRSEPARALKFNKSKNAASVNMAGAVKSLGMKAGATRKLTATIKDNLVYVTLP